MTTATSTPQRQRPLWAMSLPPRFDVHRTDFLDRLEPVRDRWVAIDGSGVNFADHAAIDALVATRLRFLDAGGDLRLVEPSTAFRVTLELTGDAALLEPAGDLVELGVR
ncbi:MAG: STAS domain-containing protein [Acidimicrobiia bacterium]|nr:STAS domain-containing protein [Acidimicrobiia bacterium]